MSDFLGYHPLVIIVTFIAVWIVVAHILGYGYDLGRQDGRWGTPNRGEPLLKMTTGWGDAAILIVVLTAGLLGTIKLANYAVDYLQAADVCLLTGKLCI